MKQIYHLKDHGHDAQLFFTRAIVAIFIICIFTIILIARLIFLQIKNYELFTTLAQNNQVRILPIPPTRGLIFDRNGILLAENVTNFSLEITPARCKNLTRTILELQQLIGLTSDEIKNFYKQKNYKSKYETIPIKEKLNELELAKFSIERYRFPEIELAARLTRHYPYSNAMAHVVGYIGAINEQELKSVDIASYRGSQNIGKAGIEKQYEHLLHGKVGYQHVETDARGRVIRALKTFSPLPGKDLILTIDAKIQQQAFELLGDKPAALVALEVTTGDILALVSTPSYDPNVFVQGIQQELYLQLRSHPKQPLFNRAISGQYPPGSTVKPIVALQALEHSVITPQTRFYDPGYYQLKDESRVFRDWNRDGHGFINLENAIAESCSTYFYMISERLGIEKIHDVFKKFGLGLATSIDFPNESIGIAPSARWKRETKRSSWYIGETLNTGIGQGYTLATPLQIANMASIIANKGYKIQPRLVKAISGTPVQIKYSHPVKLKDERNWNIITKAMQQTILSAKGTAHYLYRHNGVLIAGKTGTAQVFSLKQDEEYDRDSIRESLRDHSLFMAFAPADAPKIAVAVIIEHDRGAPIIAKKIIDIYLAKELLRLKDAKT